MNRLLADLAVGGAGGDELEYLQFALGQPERPLLGPARRRPRPLSQCPEVEPGARPKGRELSLEPVRADLHGEVLSLPGCRRCLLALAAGEVSLGLPPAGLRLQVGPADRLPGCARRSPSGRPAAAASSARASSACAVASRARDNGFDGASSAPATMRLKPRRARASASSRALVLIALSRALTAASASTRTPAPATSESRATSSVQYCRRSRPRSIARPAPPGCRRFALSSSPRSTAAGARNCGSSASASSSSALSSRWRARSRSPVPSASGARSRSVLAWVMFRSRRPEPGRHELPCQLPFARVQRELDAHQRQPPVCPRSGRQLRQAPARRARTRPPRARRC